MRYLTIASVFCIVAMSCNPNNVAKSQAGSIKSTPAPPANPASAIKEIRAEYTRINALPLTKERFNWEADGCVEGGVITYFFHDGKILKVVESGAIGDGSWVTEYYYKNGRFIFSYDVLIGGPAEGPETKKELRTYVSNDTVVQSLENKTIIEPIEKVLSATSKPYKILKAYQTKDFEAALCN